MGRKETITTKPLSLVNTNRTRETTIKGTSIKQNRMVSSELIWQCIKGGNSFMRKGINNTFFSTEPGNLTGKHSYKFSGIANKKNVGLVTDSSNAILLTKGKVKKSGKSTTVFKKDARRVMKG